MPEEPALVLQAIADKLREADPAVVGPVECAADILTAYHGQLILRAEVHHDPGSHPSVAHCHVIARIGNTTFTDPLDACVIGIDPDRQKGLVKAGHNWVTGVGSALFSILHAKPLMGATHFTGDDPWGVPGCHGFVGPMFGVGMSRPDNLTPLTNAGLFDYASAMAPPGIVHIAKVVLQANGPKGWTRTLEIDGHRANFEETPWESPIPAPDAGVLSQTAIFHYADQPAAIQARQRIDQAIHEFVSAVSATKNVDAAIDQIGKGTVAPATLNEVAAFVPLAFFRILFARLGIKFSPDYQLVSKGGTVQTRKLMREPAFARAIALCPELAASGHAEAVKLLSMYSSSFNVVNAALNKGSKPENLVMTPAIIPSPGADAADVEKAMKQLPSQFQKPHHSPQTQKKSWWRIW